MIYLDNAATTFPKPMKVKKAADSFFTRFGGNPGRSGHKISVQTAQAVYDSREAVTEFFHVPSVEQVIFTLNCTLAENMVIGGLLKKGDHVIISDMEHNSVARPVHRLAQEGVITYDIATTYDQDEKTLESFAQRIQPNTRLIATTHASNVLGRVVPVSLLGQLCKQKGILFMVDAAQSAGVLDVDVQRDNIDFLCVAGHKGLYGASGTGILIAQKGELLRPLAVGGSGSISSSLEHPDFMPDRLECGTANTLGILTIGAGIEFLKEEGREKLYRKELKLTTLLYEQLSFLKKVTLFSPYPQYEKSVPVLAFQVEGYTSEQLCAILDEKGICLRGGLHCSPLAHKKAGTLEHGSARVSLGAFTTENDIRYLVAAVKNL